MFAAPINDDLKLILLQEHHATALFAAVDRNRDHLGAWLPWVAGTKTATDTLDFIKGRKKDFVEKGEFACAIVKNGDIAGVIGLHDLNRHKRNVVIGYWLAENYTGQGIMTKAVSRILDYIFNDLALNHAAIHVDVENGKSSAIPRRFGFIHEGTLRDANRIGDRFQNMDVFGIRAEEWFTYKSTGKDKEK